MLDIFGPEEDHEHTTTAPEFRTSLFTKAVFGDTERDIGSLPNEKPVTPNTELQSDEQRVLDDIFQVTGGVQVTRKKMDCAPQWILDKAVAEELETAWKDAYVKVPEHAVPHDSNVITSHIVYKVKREKKGRKRMKARLCPHGNRDQEKGNIRNDSASAQFHVIRMMLSLATILKLKIGCIDVKDAYLQSGPISRDLYVRPPTEWRDKRGFLWKLVKLPYGISEAGRQWAQVIETWLLEEAGFQRVYGISQLFLRRNHDGDITLLIAKLTDDLLMAGDVGTMHAFAKEISGRLQISKSIVDDEVQFNGCTIEQSEDFSIKLSMQQYSEPIKPLNISAQRRTMMNDKASEYEKRAYRKMAGELIWLGSGALPQAAFIGSAMQQRLPHFRVDDLIEANKNLVAVKKLHSVLIYKRPPEIVKCAEVLTFSDAAFNVTSSQLYGQTGFITGRRLRTMSGDATIYHIIDWASGKQRRVSYSSYGAEILACTEADDRGFYLKCAMNSISSVDDFKHILNVDSKGLFDTITTLHEGRDFRLRQTVQRIRDSFEARELDVLRWVQGRVHIADALTKCNPDSHRLLNKIAATGRLCLPPHHSFELDSKSWT